MLTKSRYDGKPLLRLLELYVLKAIGELPAIDENTLENIAPQLQSIYGGGGDWFGAVANAVQMTSDTPAIICQMWASNLKIAKATGTTLSPQEFAEMFVDENFTE